MKKTKLNAPLVFIIGIITLGLANFYFIYRFSVLIGRDAKGNLIYPMREAVINVMTFGVYGIYWTVKTSFALDKREENAKFSPISTVSAVLSAIPMVRIISMAIICNRLTEQ